MPFARVARLVRGAEATALSILIIAFSVLLSAWFDGIPLNWKFVGTIRDLGLKKSSHGRITKKLRLKVKRKES